MRDFHIQFWFKRQKISDKENIFIKESSRTNGKFILAFFENKFFRQMFFVEVNLIFRDF